MAGQGFTIWFTGLPGSGKTTLARGVADALRAAGQRRIEILDGDEVRRWLSPDLGYSREDRDRQVRRIAALCGMLNRHGVIAVAAAVSPYRDARREARRAVGQFVEVYCRCALEVLIARDPKGLYRRALGGMIRNLTGVDDPYEEPRGAELTLDTGRETPAESLGRLLDRLGELGRLPEALLRPAAAPGAPRAAGRPRGG